MGWGELLRGWKSMRGGKECTRSEYYYRTCLALVMDD